MKPVNKKPRGFAAIDPEYHRQIAKMGGRAAHEQGVAHKFTSEEARVAGRIGGRKSGEVRRAAAKENNVSNIPSE